MPALRCEPRDDEEVVRLRPTDPPDATAFLERLQARLASGDHAGVLAATRHLLAAGDVAPQAALMQGVALVNLGRLDEATALLASLQAWQLPAPAAVAYLEASIAVGQGDIAQARMHLETALVEDGRYALMALNHPQLAPLLDDIEPR